MARYTPHDFIALVDRYKIAWHEKTLGQLFCDDTAKDIIRMLLTEMKEARAVLRLGAQIQAVEKTVSGFRIVTADGAIDCSSLIVASGGKSIPKMGATGLAYKIAEQFGLPLVETRPGLVPLTLDPVQLESLNALAGVAVDAQARCGKTVFEEAVLITHRGLSGPAILQISSYWREGGDISLNLLPHADIAGVLKAARQQNGRQALQTALSEPLPKRLAQFFAEAAGLSKPAARRSLRQGDRCLLPDPQGLGDQARRIGRLSHRRGDAGRRRYKGARFAHYAGARRSRPLFHRRVRRCHRMAGRL